MRGMRLGIDPIEEAARARARGMTLREAIADYCTHRQSRTVLYGTAPGPT
jgi:hypothetical protein